MSWGVDIRMEVRMPAVVGLAAAKAAAAEYLEAGGRDIGVVIRVLRIGIGRYRVGASPCVGMGLGRVLDGNVLESMLKSRHSA